MTVIEEWQFYAVIITWVRDKFMNDFFRFKGERVSLVDDTTSGGTFLRLGVAGPSIRHNKRNKTKKLLLK
jgi:hypothetical protein